MDDGTTIEATFGAEMDEYVTVSAAMEVECGDFKPEIMLPNNDIEITLGEIAEIPIEIRGKPLPSVRAEHRDRGKEVEIVQSETIKLRKILKINDSSYADAGTYLITANNSSGESSATVNVRVISKPSKPDGITVTKMTNDSCGFCWRAPEDTGKLPLINYEVAYRYAEDEQFKTLSTKNDEPNFYLQDLLSGKAIEIKVAAINRAGVGPWSDIVGPHVVSDGIFPPGYPTNVVADQAMTTSTSVPLTWDMPASDGGSPINGYLIEKQLDGSEAWEACGECEKEPRSFNVMPPAVVENKSYRFRIKARNSAGVSGGSEPTDLIIVENPNKKPAAPTSVVADNPSLDTIDVSWKPSKSELELTCYIIEVLKVGTDNWIQCGKAEGDQQAFSAQNLDPETSYMFRVYAENEIGASRLSEISNVCTTLAGSGE